MNAHFRKSINLDRSFWAILAPGDDPLTAATADEAQHIYDSHFELVGVHVVEFNPFEGWCNDVTDQFRPDDDAEPVPAAYRAYDIAASRADRQRDEWRAA